MPSLKPRLTILAALCSLIAITGPAPVQGSYMHTMDSSTGLMSHSASMMSLSESTSMSNHQLESQTLPHAESSSEPSSRKPSRHALDDRLPLRARRVAASRKDMKKYKIVGHGNGKGRKSYKKKRITSWNTLNPILSLSEWIGDRARLPKFTKRGLNNNLPPLLQQATVSKKGHREPRSQAGVSNEEQGADSFVHVRHESFSTFASRWNEGNAVRAKKDGHRPVAERERSSVVIPNKEEGDLYFISSANKKRKRDDDSTLTRVNNDRYNSRPSVQQKREDGGVPGTIDIMSTVYGSNKGARIASLVLDIANSTTDNSTTSHFVLDASSTNQTQIYLVKAPQAPASHASMSIDSDANTNPDLDMESGDIPVTLQLPIFDARQASMVRYCTTFDPSPGGPGGPLTAEPCFPWSTNSDFNTNATQTHKSQAFAFNENTGVIRPMWFNGEDDGTDHPNNASIEDDGYHSGDEDEDEAAQAPVANEDPETPMGEDMASITSLRARDVVDNSTAPAAPSNSTYPTGSRNVTLVFTPATPEVSPQQISSDAKAVGVVPSSSTGTEPATGTTTSMTATGTPNSAAAMETNGAISGDISSSSVVSASISAPVTSSSSLSAADVESTSAPAPALSLTSTTDTSAPSVTTSIAEANVETATTDSSTPSATSPSVVTTSATMSSSAVTAADIGSTSTSSLSSTATMDSSILTATSAPSGAMMVADVGSTSVPGVPSTAPDSSSTIAIDTSSSLSAADISTAAAVITDTNVGPSVTTATVSTSAATLASGLPTPVSAADIQSSSVVSPTVTDTATTMATSTPSTGLTSISPVSAADVQLGSVVSTTATEAPVASTTAPAPVSAAEAGSSSSMTPVTSDIMPTASSNSMVVSSVTPSAADVGPTSVALSSPVSNLLSSSMAAVSSSASPGPFGPQDVSFTSSSTGMATPTPKAAGVSTALPSSTSIDAEAIASIIADAYEAGFNSASPAAASAVMSISASTTDTDMPNPTPSSRVVMAAGNLPSDSSARDARSTSSAASSPSMTPVSTAPYEWMFTPDSPL